MRHRSTPMPARSRGFTLVELMVGLALAMLTILIMAQVMTKAEGNRRATTSGSDAQVNGALALFALQRDVQSAGYGLSVNPTALGCTVNYNLKGGTGSFVLAPVVITQGTNGAPDTIQVLSSAKNGGSVPAILTAAHTPTTAYFTVKSSFGIGAGDLLVAVPSTYSTGNQCSLVQAINDASYTLGDTIVPHATDANWNSNISGVMPSAGYPSGSTLVNLGSMLNRTYTISNNNLVYQELNADGSQAQQVAYSQVVQMQALYGLDTDGDGLVDTYTDVTPTSYAAWQKVLSVRLAIVSRSANYEKNVVPGSTLPEWDLGSNVSVSTTAAVKACTKTVSSHCLTIDLTADANWQHYHYRVFDTIVPLRNVLWNS